MKLVSLWSLLPVFALNACLIPVAAKEERLDPDGDGSPFPDDCAPEDSAIWGDDMAERCGDYQVNVCDHTVEQAVADCVWSDETTLADAALRVEGDELYQLEFATLAAAPDMDGDGTGEIVVGAINVMSGGGAVYVFDGETRGETTVAAATTGAIVVGADVSDPGRSVAAGWDGAAGADITVVGAWDEDDGRSDGQENGTLLVHYGPLVDTLTTDDADLKLTICSDEWFRDVRGTALGASAALIPAEDGASGVHVLAGQHRETDPGQTVAWLLRDPAALAEDEGAGRASLHGEGTVLFVHDLEEIWEIWDSPAIGTSVADGGDVDGDGQHDIVIGVSHYTTPSGVLLFSDGVDLGGDGVQPLSEAEAYLFSDQSAAGSAVASAGDVDGDGRADLIIGQNDLYGWGAVIVGDDPGSASYDLVVKATIENGWEADYTGASVVGGLNLNGDDLADVAVGAPGAYSPLGVGVGGGRDHRDRAHGGHHRPPLRSGGRERHGLRPVRGGWG